MAAAQQEQKLSLSTMDMSLDDINRMMRNVANDSLAEYEEEEALLLLRRFSAGNFDCPGVKEEPSEESNSTGSSNADHNNEDGGGDHRSSCTSISNAGFGPEERSKLTTFLSNAKRQSTNNTRRANKDRRPSAISQVRKKVSARVSIFVNDVACKENLEESHAKVVRDGITLVSMFLVVLVWGLTTTRFGGDNEGDNYASTSISGGVTALDLPIMLTALLMIAGTTRLTDTSTIGERVLLTMVCLIIIFISSFAMFVVTSPCTHCIEMSASSAVESDSDIGTGVSSGTTDVWTVWNILLSPDDDDDAHTVACRACISNIMTIFVFDGWMAYVKKRLNVFGDKDGADLIEHSNRSQTVLIPEIEYTSVQEDVGDLAAWYLQYSSAASKDDTKKFKKKVAEILEKRGHIAGEDLSDVMKEYLCSPASRMDNPDPTKFLSDLRSGRFTGEANLSNMSTATLQKIMKGDILYELGVTMCFMLRFALSVKQDFTLETKPISHTHFAPMATEADFKAVDVTELLPGTVMPTIDQDIDKEGRDIKTFKKVMLAFAQFEYEDKPIYLDSKEEYLAFYRWELENSIMDEWYFPTWLLQDSDKGEVMADLMASKLKHATDYLALENPQDDQTITDRVFYGLGQKYLTPIKLLGLDEDYGFQFPATAKSMLTSYHRQKIELFKKPSSKHLLDMVKSFYPDRVNANTTMLDWKNKILQIDFSMLTTLPSREHFYPPGSMLFIDAESKMPMGIWECERARMFLPTEGRDWLHAKYFWRTSERATIAGEHVMESHLGWSHPVSTAAWQTLPHDHGLRTLLKPFTLNAHSVNQAAYNMLVIDHSVLTHGAGVDTGEVNYVFHVIYSAMNFSQTVPEKLKSHGLDGIIDTSDMPLYSQGSRLYDVHRKFVDSFISVLYKSDEEMLQDHSVIRFWHHVNTFGRHMDPCVCGMNSDIFFDDDGTWPQNEETRTCRELLDSASFLPEKNLISRRRRWCTDLKPFDRIKEVRVVTEKACKERNPDCRLRYPVHFMRESMWMKDLKTRNDLVDFLATYIWEVTAGHQMNGDNLSYFADPEYAGVRMREFDNNGELPITTDLGTYVMGTAIASLTTVRSPPLLADWSPLYSYYASTKRNMTSKDRSVLLSRLNDIHKTYKHKLFDFSVEFLNESVARPNNQQSTTFIPAVHCSSVSV